MANHLMRVTRGFAVALTVISQCNGFPIARQLKSRRTLSKVGGLSVAPPPTSLVAEENDQLEPFIELWDASHHVESRRSSLATRQALALVHRVAKKLAKRTSADIEDDLYQEGVAALMQAMDQYPRLQNNAESFVKYAKRHIVQEMRKSVNQQVLTVQQSAGKVRQSLRQEFQREPTQQQVAQRLELQPQELRRFEASPLSVDSTFETDDPDQVTRIFTDYDLYDQHQNNPSPQGDWEQEDEEQIWIQPATLLRDKIVDSESTTPQDEAFSSILRTDMQDFLESVLNDVEYQVVAVHFGLSSGQALSLRDVARELKTTKHFVESIEEKALEKLRLSYNRWSVEQYLLEVEFN